MTTDHPQKITSGEMRSSGIRDVLVYCRDHHCSHHIRISADFWPDQLQYDLIADFAATHAGRPLFAPETAELRALRSVRLIRYFRRSRLDRPHAQIPFDPCLR